MKYFKFQAFVIFIFLCCSISSFAAEPIVFDLTSNIGDGNIKQPCIWEKKYNETNHWDECSLHYEIENNKPHNISIIGEDVCHYNKKAPEKICLDSCGYGISLPKKPHTYTSFMKGAGYFHAVKCINCQKVGLNDIITQSPCVNSLGTMSCLNSSGTCLVCNNSWPAYMHSEFSRKNDLACTYNCKSCGMEIIKLSNTSKIRLNDNQWQVSVNYSLSNNLVVDPTSTEGIDINGVSSSTNHSTLSQNGIVKYIYTFNNKNIRIPIAAYTRLAVRDKRSSSVFFIYVDISKEHYDYKPPLVTSIIQDPGDANWSSNRKVTITTSDNFSQENGNILYASILDKNNNILMPFTVMQQDINTKLYTLSHFLNTNSNGSDEQKLIVKDFSDNMSSKYFTLGKIDRESPILTKKDYVSPWRKEQKVNFTATDIGIGEISLSFNDDKNYLKLNDFSNYSFIGDVYKEQERPVFLKDALGNQSVTYIKFNKFDNTPPAIVAVKKNINNTQSAITLTLAGHDRHPTLGEGSGIASWALSTSSSIPSNEKFQSLNSYILSENGIYYAFAKDRAGNVSKPYHIDITELEKIPMDPVDTWYSENGSLRTNTEVFTTLEVINTGLSILPNNNSKLVLQLTGDDGFKKSLEKSFIVPKGHKTMVFFKWNTPSTPQSITATATITGRTDLTITNNNIKYTVKKLPIKDPPDPKATDTKGSWIAASSGYEFDTKSETFWGEWTFNQSEWIWKEQRAKINTITQITPDTKVPTSLKNGTRYEIKSGYGINSSVEASVYLQNPNANKEVTIAQNALWFFPEYNYQSYYRIGEKSKNGFILPKNKYSQYKGNVHFTPLWYPNVEYLPQIVVFDLWTPGGQLSTDSLAKNLYINGNLYEDWHITPKVG